MYKLIDSSSFFPESEPTITILHPENLKDLIKVAADSQISNFISSINPQAGKIYVHILAMGAGEFYGSNRNGDFFPEGNLLECYKTFETSPAHVFRHHINKDPAKSIGKVLYAVYNSRMHRVELISEVDKILGEDVERRIALGEYPSTSMACKTPYDVCSICGNKAHSRQEYCLHLRSQLGQMLPDGRRVMALNVAPLKFFDISIVVKPADVTSSILQKVAFSESVSSLELAEVEDLSDERIKEASFKKLSELIKRIEDGQIIRTSPHLSEILSRTKDPDYALIDRLQHVPLEHVFKGLATLTITPSIAFLAEIISRRILGTAGQNMGIVVEELVHNIGVNNIEIPKVEFDKDSDSEVSPLLYYELSKYAHDCSLLPEYVEKRASTSGVGYANLGITHVQPTQEELLAHTMESNYDEHMSLFKTLLGIGGAALLAKWYITNLIQQRSSRPQMQNNAKIVLLKKASDLGVTHKLCQASMEHVMVVKPLQPIPDPSMKDSSKAIGFSLFKRFLSRSSSPQIKNLSKVVKTIDLVGSLNQKDI